MDAEMKKKYFITTLIDRNQSIILPLHTIAIRIKQKHLGQFNIILSILGLGIN